MSGADLYLSISTPLKISGEPKAGFELHVSDIKHWYTDIPAEDVIIKAGREVLDSTTSWKQGKSYQKNTVKTSSRSKGAKDGASWYCRVSSHAKEEATFEEFWSKLGQDKAENEMQYVLSPSLC